MYNERNSLTSRHNITQDRLDTIKINQPINQRRTYKHGNDQERLDVNKKKKTMYV